LSEIGYIASLPRAEVRNALRRHGGGLDPSLRVLAEDLLGAGSTIDLVTADPNGRVVLILIGDEGADRDLFTRAIAQRAWVEARLYDWVQLAPSIGIQADAAVKLMLLCPSYTPETLAAGAALGREVVELCIYRCVRNGSDASVLVERLPGPTPPVSRPTAPSPGQAARFRSGLTEDDLNLTPLETRDFK
jgi:hypothetical protein